MLSSKIKLKEDLFKNIDFLINKKIFQRVLVLISVHCWLKFWKHLICSLLSYYTIKLKISRPLYIKKKLSWQKKTHWRQNSKINICIMNKVFYYYKLEENEVNKFDLLKEHKSYSVLISINTWFNRPDESTSTFVQVDILSSGL